MTKPETHVKTGKVKTRSAPRTTPKATPKATSKATPKATPKANIKTETLADTPPPAALVQVHDYDDPNVLLPDKLKRFRDEKQANYSVALGTIKKDERGELSGITVPAGACAGKLKGSIPGGPSSLGAVFAQLASPTPAALPNFTLAGDNYAAHQIPRTSSWFYGTRTNSTSTVLAGRTGSYVVIAIVDDWKQALKDMKGLAATLQKHPAATRKTPPPSAPSKTFTIDVPMSAEDGTALQPSDSLGALRDAHEGFLDELVPEQEVSCDSNTVRSSHPQSSVSGRTLSSSTPSVSSRSVHSFSSVQPQFNLDSAASLLESFREGMLPHFPVIVLTPDETVPSLTRDRPFVLLAILAAASGGRSLQGHSLYDEEFRKVLALKFLSSAVLRMATMFTDIVLHGYPLLKFPHHDTRKRDQTPPEIIVDPSSLITCTKRLREWYDYIASLPASEFANFAGTDWARLIMTVILGLRLSFPIPNECPGWDHNAARQILDLGSFLHRFSKDEGDTEIMTPASGPNTDVLSASRIVFGVVKRKYEARLAALEKAAIMEPPHPTPPDAEKGLHKCPMFDGSLDPYLQTWDDYCLNTTSFATPPLSTSALDAGSIAVDGTGSARDVQSTIFHDLWATMTMGWSQQGSGNMDLSNI
ncbi:hypothetical protein VMCG_01965 [Cytospora schulzeri]|uniref:Transcription factor domain-containing protein n=1 Tax=Cytospora schulzeri TaxID=448051 RepID=A0A423X2W5_9PEZI|nr:hypothetical protein VMCG_01965 [Valsa malicola]